MWPNVYPRVRRQHVDVFLAFRVPYPSSAHRGSALTTFGTGSPAGGIHKLTLLLLPYQKRSEEGDNYTPTLVRTALRNEARMTHL